MTDKSALELCQILTDLNFNGQQTLLIPDLFIEPNFPLVYDILIWLASILSVEGKYNAPFKQSNHMKKDDAILVLIELGKFFSGTLGIRLNLVSIYRGDTLSCPELLKIVKPIHEAAKVLVATKGTPTKKESESLRDNLFDETTKTLDYLTKNNAQNEIANVIQSTQELEVLLSKEEGGLGAKRVQIIERDFDISNIGLNLVDLQKSLVDEIEKLKIKNKELDKDMNRLDEKLSIKEEAIQSANDTLAELEVQSPAYLNQYNRLHREYESVYNELVANIRNVTYLEACVYSSPIK